MNPHDYKILYYDTTFYGDGFYLGWLKPPEIHINKIWENTPIALEIINHEMKHAEIMDKIIKIEKSKDNFRSVKISILILYNYIWDCFSSAKSNIKKFLFLLNR